MQIKPLRKDLEQFIKTRNLAGKWLKAKSLFENNLRHPSLHVELLEPRWHGIYSFRLDRKYRALFFITDDGRAEVFQITKHYKKK
ncbi:hypothetical protein HQ544_03295 [Candidatus Falkowbacteria bacterium]|nr:hypothetical protein [Candidatus Falkowbacteria bacterium]